MTDRTFFQCALLVSSQHCRGQGVDTSHPKKAEIPCHPNQLAISISELQMMDYPITLRTSCTERRFCHPSGVFDTSTGILIVLNARLTPQNGVSAPSLQYPASKQFNDRKSVSHPSKNGGGLCKNTIHNILPTCGTLAANFASPHPKSATFQCFGHFLSHPIA